MSLDVKVPAAGESITSANVARWHKKNGDVVKKGEILVTLETDKVSNELEAAAEGVLEILVGEGEEVSIGTVIARISGEIAAAAPVAAPAIAPAAAPGGVVELKVPAAGESITSANVAKWRKKDGEQVVQGEVLVTLETDKVSNELEAPASGSLKIIVPEGEEVSIGAIIATIDAGALASAGESQAAAPIKAEPVAAQPASTPNPPPVANERNPEPAPLVAAKPRVSGGLSGFDSLIDAAPEVSEPPAPVEVPPWKNDKPAVEAKPPEPVPVVSPLEDAFHNDPLIQAALVKFEGKVLA